MDYGNVLSRAWEITWRWKILWLLGFLAALGRGGGGRMEINISTSGGEWSGEWGGGQIGGQLPGFQIPSEVWAGLAALACLGMIIGLIIWVVSIIARGGLIAGVQQVEDEGTTTFGQAWSVGVSRFWTLFGIGFLSAIPFLLLGLAAAIYIALTWTSGIGLALQTGDPTALFSAIGSTFCCFFPLCCGMIFLGAVVGQIRVYAERAAVLEGLGWIDAFKRGWQVLRENLGPTVVFWLIFIVVGFVLALIVGAVVGVLIAPVIALVPRTEPNAWLFVPTFCGGILAVIVFALLGAVIETFVSATWTLAYRRMTGQTLPAAPRL